MFNKNKDRLEFLTDDYGNVLEGKDVTDEEKKLYPKYANPYVRVACLDGEVRGLYAYSQLYYEEESEPVVSGEALWHDFVLPLVLALKRGGIEEVFISQQDSEEENTKIHEIGIFVPFEAISHRRQIEFFLNEAFSKSIQGMIGNIFQIIEGVPVA